MYDFYSNPPNSKKELREWLTSWLLPPSPAPEILEYKGEKFIQEFGFRRSHYIHNVYRSLSTNEYIWWVFEDGDDSFNTFPTIRFPTYEAMLENTINDYYINWKLTD